MIERIAYLVSTHASYCAPLERLLSSMREIDPKYVFIASGGYKKDIIVKRHDQFTVRQVTHNSFDYTALITLLEHNLDVPNHVFLLHDTMELGPSAVRLIRSAPSEYPAIAVWRGYCNLMLLRTDYIRDNASKILELKNCTKQQAINTEGFLWRKLMQRHAHYPGECQKRGTALIYHGAERSVMHYTGVDILKYQANWGQNQSYDPNYWVVRP